MKKFTLTISVDENTLKQSYLDRQDLIEEEDLPSVPEIIQQEFGWLEASGISLISEVQESQLPLSEFDIFQALSGNFLCEYIPDNWLDLTEEEQNQFVQEHAWQPIEYLDVDEIYELIQCATDNMVALLKIYQPLTIALETNKTISWGCEDIKEVAQERFNSTISDEDTQSVLEFLVNQHDANIGINWDSIYYSMEYLLEHDSISLNPIAMNEQQVIDQLFRLSNGTLLDWADWRDPNEPEHNPFIPIRLSLISPGEYQLYYGYDLINDEPSTYQWKVFVDDYLFPETSLEDCSSLFDLLQDSLLTLSDNQRYQQKREEEDQREILIHQYITSLDNKDRGWTR